MKKFLLGILSILLVFLSMALVFSYTINDICINTISSAVVKNEMTSRVIDGIKNNYPDVSNETLEDIETTISNSDEINKITEKYFNNIINYVSNKEELKLPSTDKEIENIINEINNTTDNNKINISDSGKKKIIEYMNNKSLSKVYEKTAKNLKENLSDDQAEVANFYNFFKSENTKIILVVAIIIDILLMMLILKSFYKWMVLAGSSLLVSGGMLLIVVPLIANKISDVVTNELIGTSSSLNLNSINDFGYIMLLVGFALMVLYFVINSFKKKVKKS